MNSAGISAVHAALRCGRYAWAAPCSAVGLVLGLVAWLGGATVRVRAGALEFGGGRAGAWATRLPASCAFSAITFGHVILGTDHATLAAARTHEQVHVRQYERWGLLFFPAYLLSSAVQWARGRDPYLDNRFEREARALATGAPSRPTC